MKAFVGLSSILPPLALAAALPAFAGSITINATFNSSLNAAEDAAINAAIGSIEAAIKSPDNLTVSLYFDSTNSGLGQSNTGFYGLSYYQYYNALAAVATQPNQLAALASLGPAPTGPTSGNPVTGSDQIDVTSVEARNLGINDPAAVTVNGGTYDSEIFVNTSLTYPPNPNNGSTYGLQAVANHEIDEALGIGGAGSTIGGTGFFANPGDLDLFRYTCSDPDVATTLTCPTGDVSRSYSPIQTTNPYSYFSVDGGNTVLSFFNQTSGADYGDWLSNPIPAGFSPQVQDAYALPGTNPALGVNELTALNAIGYDLVAPEPGTLIMFGLGISAIIAWRRRGP